ncbi:MAG: hypothetical protein ABIA93_00195 [Candidatus Woesearchaeota archaeon]
MANGARFSDYMSPGDVLEAICTPDVERHYGGIRLVATAAAVGYALLGTPFLEDQVGTLASLGIITLSARGLGKERKRTTTYWDGSRVTRTPFFTDLAIGLAGEIFPASTLEELRMNQGAYGVLNPVVLNPVHAQAATTGLVVENAEAYLDGVQCFLNIRVPDRTTQDALRELRSLPMCAVVYLDRVRVHPKEGDGNTYKEVLEICHVSEALLRQ